ncbi:MAG: hypothetical protein K8Q99_00325 [Acholeplasmataceae bacterium]|nr:hypothetical protein [Acholeplasmataceae bacterium]
MAEFHIHFFKEKSRKIDLEVLISFFEDIKGFIVEMDNDSVRFLYTHPRLGQKARFVITPKSQVPDIYRLSPKFLDLNFHLEMDLLSPNYIANILFDLVKQICDRFNFHIYNEMFEDVLPYKAEVVQKVYHMLKQAYIDKNPVILSNYFILKNEKLNAIYRYLDEMYELQKYYQEMETYVPSYHFLKTESKKLVLGIEFKEHTLSVFPPEIDYVFYRSKDDIKVYQASQVLETIDAYVQDVPGFIKGTKVIPKKNLKKVHKLMKKTKFDLVSHTFEKEVLKHLLDI